jgi:hypothetical protein
MSQLLQSGDGLLYLRRVDVPNDFRVSLPRRLEELVASSKLELDTDNGLSGRWVSMSGGPLTRTMHARVGKTDDGRLVVTGLLLGLDDEQEITWESLRAIKPASLLSYLFSGFDPESPQRAYSELADKADASGDVDSQSELIRHLVAARLWTATSFARNKAEAVLRSRRGMAADLTEFAEVYRRHYATQPRRATTATAKELNISRATAIRRIAECRAKNLLPSEAQS